MLFYTVFIYVTYSGSLHFASKINVFLIVEGEYAAYIDALSHGSYSYGDRAVIGVNRCYCVRTLSWTFHFRCSMSFEYYFIPHLVFVWDSFFVFIFVIFVYESFFSICY